MELSSSGLPDRLNNLNKAEQSPTRDKDEISDIQEQMVQRCVIIQKDEKGYGLTVSGDNPVFVQSVKEDGAAARAGVQQGDRIIKVNGTLVTQSNHQDVVELIKSGSYVALTLLGIPPGHGRTSSGNLQPLNISGNNSSPHSVASNKLSSPSERITGPQPVDPEKQQQLTNSRIHTIRKMLEKEVVYLENLRMEYSKTPSEKIHVEVTGATNRVKTLEEQLINLTGTTHFQIIPKSPKSPPASHFHRHHHSEKENNRHSVTSPTSGHPGRFLTHQVSAPSLPPKPDLLSISHAKAHTGEQNATQENVHMQDNLLKKDSNSSTQPSFSTSLENIDKQFANRSTTWPQVGPTHSRQSSSPEALMKHVESLRHHKHPRTLVSDSLCRSHSEASKHFHKSPVSETVSGLDKKCMQRKSSSSRDTSLGQYESAPESPLPSPTGSPPPEYSELQTELSDAGEGDEVIHEEYGTPPESVATDINMHSVVSKLGQNPSIICMEDDEFSSDTELGHVDDHGPFNGLWKLVRNPAHLAVFMQYLMSSDSSSSLFFYLITDIYEQGTGKEMKKWAYEIHSSFLVPGAPLKVATVDEAILHEIDKVLLNHIDREEILRGVFNEARKKAREELNDLLAVFRNKRTMGLANIFSPPDYQLEEAMQDKIKEIKIIEQLLVSYLENLPDDLENTNDSLTARTFALTTILKQFGVKSQHAINLIDRWPTFVAKEKSRLRFLQRNKKIMFVQGHQFIPQHYYSVTYCNHCQLIIWGVGNQGYQCQNCEMNIHKMCVRIVEEHCIGSLRNKKDKKRDRMSGIMENFMGKARKPSQPVPSAIEKARKLNEEGNLDTEMLSSYESGTNENSHNSAIDGKADHKVTNDASHPLHLHNDLDRPNFHNKKGPAGIGRSESFRQRRESRPSFRKRSDPNIPRSKSDVEVDDKTATNLNSGSSSNSSLSNRSLDSPSTSSDMVHRTLTGTSTDSVPPYSTTTPGVPSPLTNTPSTAHTYDDSDLDTEADPPNWQDSVEWDVLRVMKPKQKKRQDVINELFHTEKTHVRNLKVLDRIFYKPLLQEQLLPPDFLQLLFPNLEEMIEIHSCFNKKLKIRRKEEAIIGDIGQLLLEMFDGLKGEHLKKAAAIFCQNQSIALESLKMRQKKEQKLAQFFAEAELHNLCRRLQLKDIIASGFQRLTKYPLLLENIAKYTAPDTQELTDLLRSIDCSKEILVHVDSSVKEAENLHRLSDIQKKLEKSAFEKIEHPIVHSFKNLDVTKHKLIYEGQLTWRLNKQKTVDMHVVLLEDILVLLQKQDEKYVLKFHNTNLTTSKEETKIMHSPILWVHNLLIRNNATDKRSIFLISSSEMHAMYEFVALTASEKKIWCRYLTEAVERNTIRSEHPLKQPELPHTIVPDHVPVDETSAGDTLNKESSSKDVTKGSINAPSDSLETPESTSSCPSEDVSTDLTNTSIEDPPSDSSAPSTASEDTTTVGNGSEQQSKPQRRLQRVEILKIADGPQLIEPSEVIICEGAVLQTAEPVLTPLEKLRRKDQEITTAIHAKEQLIEEIFQIPHDVITKSEEFDESEGRSIRELMSATVHQGHQLSLLLSEMLNVSVEGMSNVHNNDGIDSSAEESLSAEPLPHSISNVLRKSLPVPVTLSNELLSLSVSLNKKHTQLLALLTEADEEREHLRNELINSREQIHRLHENHRHCTIQSQSPSNHSQSRPNSFVSVGSSISEDVTEVPEEQCSVLHKVVEETDTFIDMPPSLGIVNSDVQLSMQADTVVNVSNHEFDQLSLPPEHLTPGNVSCNSVLPTTDLDCDLKMTETPLESINGNSGGIADEFVTQDCSSLQSLSDVNVVETSVDPIYF